MPQMVDNSVYLVKGLPLSKPDGGLDNYEWTDIGILEEAVRPQLDTMAHSHSSAFPNAIADCIKELQSGPSIRIWPRDDRKGFEIQLYKTLVERLCSILPEPSLQFQFRIRGRTTRGRLIGAVLERRVELTDALRHFVDVKWITRSRIAPVSECKGETVTCDVILEWSEPCIPKPAQLDMAIFGRKLFEKESSKDLVIVAGNGTESKCHRVVFEAHSEVLAAMVSPELGMRESQTGRVEMRENSEEGLGLLIRYFYGLELTMDDLSCDLAVELIMAAHKYKLTELVGSLTNLFLDKGSDWFTPNDLLELYFLAKNLEEWKWLTDHALKIMLNFALEIQSCERYHEVYRTDPQAARDLVMKLLKLEMEQNRKAAAVPAKQRKRGGNN